jgi:predicted RNA-binding protein with TRAM domain
MSSHINDKTTTRSRYNNKNAPKDTAKPVELGREYDVKISQTSYRGDGIAKVRGFVIFVKKTKVADENVKIKITHIAETYALADLIV